MTLSLNQPAQPDPAPPGSRPVTLAPQRRISPDALPQPGPSEGQLLEYLYQELRRKYPMIPDEDLRLAAKTRLGTLRSKQASEFYGQYMPDRMPPQAPQPAAPSARDVEGSGRPWRWTGNNYEFTDTAESRDGELMRRLQAEEQRARAMQNPRPPARPSPPGQASPIEPPAPGTPYDPGAPLAAPAPEDVYGPRPRKPLPAPGSRYAN
jgi:hypothetical protein